MFFIKQKQRRKTKKNETETRNQKKTTTKTRRKEEKRETEQENVKEGGGKRGVLQEKERETLKNTQKCPFLWGKTFYEKQRKERTPPQKNQKGKNKPKNETKTKKGLMKQNIVIEYFDVVVFMKPKQRRNKNKKQPFTICTSQFSKKQPPLDPKLFLNLHFSERKH